MKQCFNSLIHILIENFFRIVNLVVRPNQNILRYDIGRKKTYHFRKSKTNLWYLIYFINKFLADVINETLRKELVDKGISMEIKFLKELYKKSKDGELYGLE